jgi:hypothetical protein
LFNILHFTTAGHDTTLSALLAGLLGEAWDRKWPPYAALLAIELYSAKPRQESTNTRSGTDNNLITDRPQAYFRMVYNGEPLVLKGCASALCDLEILLEALSFGQKGIPAQCEVSLSSIDTSSENDLMLTQMPDVWQTEDWLLVMVVSSLVSTLIGAVITWKMFENQQKQQSRKLLYSEVPSFSSL